MLFFIQRKIEKEIVKERGEKSDSIQIKKHTRGGWVEKYKRGVDEKEFIMIWGNNTSIVVDEVILSWVINGQGNETTEL